MVEIKGEEEIEDKEETGIVQKEHRMHTYVVTDRINRVLLKMLRYVRIPSFRANLRALFTHLLRFNRMYAMCWRTRIPL